MKKDTLAIKEIEAVNKKIIGSYSVEVVNFHHYDNSVLLKLEAKDSICAYFNGYKISFLPFNMSMSIEKTKQFSKDLQKIISIAEQCKKILTKYGQYEEKRYDRYKI